MNLAEYITDARILKYVFRERAKLAKRRNHQILINNIGPTTSDRDDGQRGEDETILCSILPPRRTWKKLHKDQRTGDDGYPINSHDKTIQILRITVNWFKANQPYAPFLVNLNEFTQNVRSIALDPDSYLPRPHILPIRKKPNELTCRPIAVYPLATKIAICIVNGYLSKRFDEYFSASSYAFRFPSQQLPPNHHDAFRIIIDARLRRMRMNYWVTEADIQKFFDTVNHSIIRKLFARLVMTTNRDHPDDPICPRAIEFFSAYLNSYNYPRDVLPHNSRADGCFSTNGFEGCKFGWVEAELISESIYRAPRRAQIGIPQGGALSGLIANIMLHEIDRRFDSQDDPYLIYVRYCDDMILLHRRKHKCKHYLDMYLTQLRKLKLIAHNPVKISTYNRDYWSHKSKLPFKWGPAGFVPWIGFVGYEIHYDGSIRARKSSIEKEMKKQFTTLQEVQRAVHNGPSSSKHYIQESVTNRLIQMAVGRMRLHNYHVAINDMCWVNGFRLINDNKYSRIQMKRLDTLRNDLLRRLRKQLLHCTFPDKKTKRRTKQTIFYGKPFSYYYHIIEKDRQR